MNKQTDTIKLSNGVGIPCIGYGTWQTPDGDAAVKCVKEAIKCGYTHIDTAAIYGNEVGVGQGIKESGIEREKRHQKENGTYPIFYQQAPMMQDMQIATPVHPEINMFPCQWNIPEIIARGRADKPQR